MSWLRINKAEEEQHLDLILFRRRALQTYSPFSLSLSLLITLTFSLTPSLSQIHIINCLAWRLGLRFSWQCKACFNE